MKGLFDLENPLMQVLTRLADLILLSLCFILCCLPVVTIGPSACALFRTVFDITQERSGSVLRRFFQAFRADLKQAFKVWLAALTGFVALFCYHLLARLYLDGAVGVAVTAVAAGLALLLTALLAYVLPLLGRYEGPIRQHVKNAAILMVIRFPRTLAMTAMHLLPLLVLRYLPLVFLYTLLLWIVLAPGLIAQLDVYLLRPVFDYLETDDEDSSTEA